MVADNLEIARDLGETIYTQAEVDALCITNISTAQTKIGDLTIGESIGVSSWSFATTTITINTSAVHNLIVGQYFRVTGLVATTNAPNGRWVVASVVDTDTITFTSVDTPTGTPTVSSATLEHGDMTMYGSFTKFDLAQTWTVVTGSRSSGVTYTNTTGRPIDISILQTASGIQTGIITVAGVVADTVSGNGVPLTLRTVVPNGSTYILSGLTGSLAAWSELR